MTERLPIDLGGLFLWPQTSRLVRSPLKQKVRLSPFELGGQEAAIVLSRYRAMKSCCITGHRKTGISENLICSIVQELTLAAIADGANHFYMGCSWGVDLIAGQVWTDMFLDWTAVKPCADHGVGVWLEAMMEYRDRVLKQAQEIETLRERYKPGCLNARNEWMVNRSEIVIAIFDGRQRGGTKHCLSYARRQGKRIIWYDLRDGQIKSVN